MKRVGIPVLCAAAAVVAVMGGGFPIVRHLLGRAASVLQGPVQSQSPSADEAGQERDGVEPVVGYPPPSLHPGCNVFVPEIQAGGQDPMIVSVVGGEMEDSPATMARASEILNDARQRLEKLCQRMRKGPIDPAARARLLRGELAKVDAALREAESELSSAVERHRVQAEELPTGTAAIAQRAWVAAWWAYTLETKRLVVRVEELTRLRQVIRDMLEPSAPDVNTHAMREREERALVGQNQ